MMHEEFDRSWPPKLESPADDVWAKTSRSNDDTFLPLWVHMFDAGGVSERLWNEWLPASITDPICDAAGGDVAGRVLVKWLATVHDLGKATPAFSHQVRHLSDLMERHGLTMPNPPVKSSSAPHSVASQVLLGRWLEEEHQWSRGVADSYAVVPGGHHGVPPESELLAALRGPQQYMLGATQTWKKTQRELASYAATMSGAGEFLSQWSGRPLPETAQTILTAIVIISDWIASGELFEYDLESIRPQRVQQAWERLDMPSYWHATSTKEAAAEKLIHRFGMPPTTTSRPIQESALELVSGLDGSGLLVVEAPMGEGKTELALLCAEVMASHTGAGGIFYGLPTMATSDGIFPRIRRWVDHLPDSRGSGFAQTTFLAHSKAKFNMEYQGLERVGEVRIMSNHAHDGHAMSEAMVAHIWLTGRKKGLLSNFVVGTVDQALMLALKAKHVVLRHLALAGKVVVIDEVHASDAYMKVYLRRLLRWLGAYRVPTILMSATLQPEDRVRFAAEYAQEEKPRSRPGAKNRNRAQQWVSRFEVLKDESGYPHLTAITPSGNVTTSSPAASARSSRVVVERINDEDTTLVDLLRQDLSEGGSVAIIRNTVSRAQRTALLLQQEFRDAHVVLCHSRFLSRDRLGIEEWLRQQLGPSVEDDRQVRFSARPLIVVGTQVLEQSLDVDFDLMVSDLAPIDLVLQRAGRLHRHARTNRPAPLSEPRLILTGVDWEQAPPQPDDGSKAVYGDFPLLAAVRALDTCTNSELNFPADIARLVATASQTDENVPQSWQEQWNLAQTKWKKSLADSQQRAEKFLLRKPQDQGTLVNLLDARSDADGEIQGQAQVRDADASLEVIVVQRVDDEVRVMPRREQGGPGATIPTEFWNGSRKLEYEISSCSIRLPRTLTVPWRIDTVIDELEDNRFAAWQQSHILAGELVLVLDENLQATVAGVDLRYDYDLGLLIGKDTDSLSLGIG